MLRSLRGRRSLHEELKMAVRLCIGIATGILATGWADRPARADRQAGPGGGPASVPVCAWAGPGEAGSPAKPRAPAGVPRVPGLAGPSFLPSAARSVTDGWGPGWAGVALVLAICGGVAAAIRRYVPRVPTAAVQVVGRVSLSPKHSVYLLRVGRRVLLVGAGPQGPPSLISELDDLPESPPNPSQGEAP
jgi:hypothetical protein